MSGGFKPPHSVSHIHIGCIQSVWAFLYDVDGHLSAPLYCYSGKEGPNFCNIGVSVVMNMT